MLVEIGVEYQINWMLLFSLGTLGESYLRAYTTETYVGALLVLIFPHADVGTDVMGHIFP